jgi:hypothetical protein
MYIGWLTGQLDSDKVRLPASIGEEFWRQIKSILSGCEDDSAKDNDVWRLDKAKTKYIPLKAAIEDVISAIKEAAENG